MNEVTKQIEPELLDYLCKLDWSGNIRQLENTCRWFSVMTSGGRIQINDLPEELLPEAPAGNAPPDHDVAGDWSDSLRRWARQALAAGEQDLLSKAAPKLEKTLVECALERSGGRKQEAAHLLGWGRNTLTRKLKELYK
jgi:two-component system nitrogen regulation response regulator GlnG